MKKILRILCCLSVLFCFGCQSKTHLDAGDPTTIKVWNYYSGKQLESFTKLIDEFNKTVGKEKGIIVDTTSFGNVNELGQSVIDAANKKVGAKEVPDIFAAYADTAYQMDALGLVEDLKPYFSDEALNKYIEGYIKEGYLNKDKQLKIFPIAKSTEVMMINMTDFEKFAKATGVSLQDLSTIEGVTSVSKKYYEYTDSLTSIKNDGKAFFGRDAMANYLIIGLKQFGHDIVSVSEGKTTLDFDKETVKKLWDNYYVPYVRGYFSSQGRFRSDDVKIGNIISCVNSSSGSTFFPDKVITDDNKSYSIDVKTIAAPLFKDGKNIAVQQGAGMVVTKSDEAHVEASVEFLKWFTESKQNINFSIDSGYLPVTKEANQTETIQETTKIESQIVKEVIDVSVNTVNNSNLYTTQVFDNGTKFRNELEKCLQTQAESDRKVIKKELKQGKDYDEVISQYDNNQNFEQWYNKTYEALNNLMG
ncbi:MAG: extracellular solute-binding protein [Coprobacillus sp.]